MNDEDTSDSNGEQTPSTPALMPPGWPLDLYTTSHAQIPSVAQVNRPDAVETRHHSENFLASDDGHPRKIARPLATQYAGRQLPLHQQQTTQASLPSIQPWQHSGYPPQHSQQFGNTGQDEQSGQQQQPFVGRTMSDSQHQYVSGPQITQRLGSPASFSSASVPTPPPQQLYALPANAQQYSLPHLVPKSSSYAPQYEEQPIQGSVPYSHNLVSAPMSRPALQVVTGPLSRPSDFCQMPTLYTQHMQQQTPQGPIYSQNGQNVQHVQQQQMPHVSMYGHNAQNVHQQEIGMGPGYGYSGQHVQSSQQPDFVASAPMSATVPFIYQQQQPAANGNGMFASPNDQYGGSHSATF